MRSLWLGVALGVGHCRMQEPCGGYAALSRVTCLVGQDLFQGSPRSHIPTCMAFPFPSCSLD